MTGQIEPMPMYAGQGVQGITEVLSAASIVERTVEEAAGALARSA
jgi:NAD(P)H-dependent flavin oxidoreductase YrpB (nitropropane dioxygenase family)